MADSIAKITQRIIEFSFYGLFFLVPLVLSSQTSELFELNKMWLLFALTIVISASWLIKSIAKKEFKIIRTPFDIPILIFLASQIISTVFSIDRHVSVWGYYSRFNGGLLSIISYVILYYSFVSNFNSEPIKIVKRIFLVSLVSGAIVALWGLPSHFGYDPTCLIFRRTFDVSCWTDAFQPKVRIFSTLGQPDWLAAYLVVLLPFSIILFLRKFQPQINPEEKVQSSKEKSTFSILNFLKLSSIFYLPLSILFYVDLLFTKSRSNLIAFAVSFIFLITLYLLLTERESKLGSFKEKILQYWYLLGIFVFVGIITFFVGTSFPQLDKFTFPEIKNRTEQKKVAVTEKPKAQIIKDVGATHSGTIRLLVWQGAIDAWKNYPIFGSGVETFAFAYYRYRPIGHNMTSEWDFLYNKAHNEYLNYLTTTGLFGLGSYLFMIGYFMFYSVKLLNSKYEYRNPKQFQNQNDKNQKQKGLGNLNFENYNLFRASDFGIRILPIALVASYIAILVSNFFGFSVVIINLYLFLIPAFFLFITNQIPNNNEQKLSLEAKSVKIDNYQTLFIAMTIIAALYIIFSLYKFRDADINYALGSNLDKIGRYQEAYPELHKAVEKRGDEPVFRDEMSFNDAVLAAAFVEQKDATSGAKLAEEAITANTQLVSDYPNNIIFWKTRARIFYALSRVDPSYLKYSLEALTSANKLAPTDAKISYNLAIMYGETGNKEKAVEILENTTKLKPDYRDAYYALGIYYHDLAGENTSKKAELEQKARNSMEYILSNISSFDQKAKENLNNWAK